MAAIYINDTRNRPTVYDAVKTRISETSRRCGGVSNTTKAMHEILDDACINTNDTFLENGEIEVSLEKWNKEFTRNVEFLMANSDNAVAVGNLKHFGFHP